MVRFAAARVNSNNFHFPLLLQDDWVYSFSTIKAVSMEVNGFWVHLWTYVHMKSHSNFNNCSRCSLARDLLVPFHAIAEIPLRACHMMIYSDSNNSGTNLTASVEPILIYFTFNGPNLLNFLLWFSLQAYFPYWLRLNRRDFLDLNT